jgi:hypothetical protein
LSGSRSNSSGVVAPSWSISDEMPSRPRQVSQTRRRARQPRRGTAAPRSPGSCAWPMVLMQVRYLQCTAATDNVRRHRRQLAERGRSGGWREESDTAQRRTSADQILSPLAEGHSCLLRRSGPMPLTPTKLGFLCWSFSALTVLNSSEFKSTRAGGSNP